MEEDSVASLPRPGSGVTDDPLPAVLREGARRLLMQAIDAEVEAFLAAHAGLVDEQGRRRFVRNGHAPERRIQTGIGAVEVRRPKARDRGVAGEEAIRFTSAILPAYLRRTKNLEELLPWLYLKGVSTGSSCRGPSRRLTPYTKLAHSPLGQRRDTRRGSWCPSSNGP
jgi:putative transposase